MRKGSVLLSAHVGLDRVHGNRCGHDPLSFRRFVPPSHHHPRILEEARSRIGECLGHFWNERFRSERQKRSERREACALLLSCLIHRMDLVTLRVGIPGEGTHFRGYTDLELSRMTGLGLRRLERAMQDLVSGGLLKVERRCKKERSGGFSGRPSIRTISSQLFDWLGLGKRFRKERSKAKNRQQGRELEQLSQKTFQVLQKALRVGHIPKAKTREDFLEVLGGMRRSFSVSPRI